MSTTYRGGWRPGDTVRLKPVRELGMNLWGRPGVIAFADGNVERALQPGEVPVRIAMVPADKRREEETAVYLLLPEWIEEAELNELETDS
jgi:hypothetical protein